MLNISMASPSGDTSMADFSMASISMGDVASSDDNGSSRSDGSNTQIVKIEQKKRNRGSGMVGSLKPQILDKLDEVEDYGEEEGKDEEVKEVAAEEPVANDE